MSEFRKSHKHDERRSRHRSNINLPIKATLLIPEDTNARHQYNGMAKNISYTGMMCVVFGIQQDTYRKLMDEKHYMTVEMKVAGYNELLHLKGRIIWVDYHPNAIPNEYCNIGLAFEDLDPEENKTIINMIRDINKRPDTTY